MKPKKRVLVRPARRRSGKRTVKIFISHSSRDSSFVTLLTELLKTADLRDDEIRCTSVPTYGLQMGTEIANNLRDDIEQCKIIIAVLTKDALDSFQVLLELGAGWGLRKSLVPITGPGIKLEDLPEWLRTSHGMRWDHEECWWDFEADIFNKLRKTLRHRKRFRGIIKELIKWQPVDGKQQ